MAMYHCEGCQGLVDDDWHPMSESGRCPECQSYLDEEEQEAAEAEINGEDYRKPKVPFAKGQKISVARAAEIHEQHEKWKESL